VAGKECPFPVKQAVQAVVLGSAPPAAEVQAVPIAGVSGGTFLLRYLSAATGAAFATPQLPVAGAGLGAKVHAALRAQCLQIPEMCAVTAAAAAADTALNVTLTRPLAGCRCWPWTAPRSRPRPAPPACRCWCPRTAA